MFSDRWVLAAMAVGGVLRTLPLLLWGATGCIRDECTYKELANGIVNGNGLLPNEGWLWAPGWPYTMALFQFVFGSAHAVRGLQVALSVLSIGVLATLVQKLADARAGRIAAWLFALHATFAWFAGSLFSESIYTALLLLAVGSLLWAREGRWTRAIVPGVLVGACVLFRGVATYMGPIFMLVALWPVEEAVRDALRRRWAHALTVGLAMFLTVAPYSVYATNKYGGLVISDATLGQMMWLGDNNFPPMTFDWGNGQVHDVSYQAYARLGRRHCSLLLPPPAWDRCERERGMEWIEKHPGEFVARVPVRLAQLVTPHTLLTRHVRLGRFAGLPFELKELLCVCIDATSFLVVLGGGAAAFLRGKGPFGLLAAGVVAYHMLAIAMLAGLSRYRLPLEPFGIAFLAIALADPRGTATIAREQPVRTVLAALWVLAIGALMLRTFPDGYPGWR